MEGGGLGLNFYFSSTAIDFMSSIINFYKDSNARLSNRTRDCRFEQESDDSNKKASCPTNNRRSITLSCGIRTCRTFMNCHRSIVSEFSHSSFLSRTDLIISVSHNRLNHLGFLSASQSLSSPKCLFYVTFIRI